MVISRDSDYYYCKRGAIANEIVTTPRRENLFLVDRQRRNVLKYREFRAPPSYYRNIERKTKEEKKTIRIVKKSEKHPRRAHTTKHHTEKILREDRLGPNRARGT